MSIIIAFTEVRTRLSEILDLVSNGEEFIITRHGETIAKLVPLKRDKVKQAVQELRKLRKGTKINRNEIITWKNQGRR